MTTFTFSKINSSCCGETDQRIKFSTTWTMVNCFVSTTVVAVVSSFITIREVQGNAGHDYWSLIFIPIIMGQMLGVACTAAFVWFDFICCCCCACWRGGSEAELMVYDPDNPEDCLVWRDGEVVNMDKQY